MSPIVEQTETDGNRRVIHCVVPEDLTVLQGHFPGLPIVAGVCQIKWVVDFWNQFQTAPASIERLSRVKFHQFLKPGDHFKISMEETGGGVKYRLFNDQVSYASGTLVLRP